MRHNPSAFETDNGQFTLEGMCWCRWVLLSPVQPHEGHSPIPRHGLWFRVMWLGILTGSRSAGPSLKAPQDPWALPTTLRAQKPLTPAPGEASVSRLCASCPRVCTGQALCPVQSTYSWAAADGPVGPQALGQLQRSPQFGDTTWSTWRRWCLMTSRLSSGQSTQGCDQPAGLCDG